jgi:hypothetical protein
MQVKDCQVVSTAALIAAAHIRFLQCCASQSVAGGESVHDASLHRAVPGSPENKAICLILKVFRFFKQCHDFVIPMLSHSTHSQMPSSPPHEGQRLLAEHLPSQNERLKQCLASLRVAFGAASLFPHSPQEAVSACVAQQASCILSHLSLASRALPVPKRPDTLERTVVERIKESSGENQGQTHSMMKESLRNTPAALSNCHVTEEVGVSQPGSVHRTLLACEGIAINCLFSHGRLINRVKHSHTFSSCLQALTVMPVVPVEITD